MIGLVRAGFALLCIALLTACALPRGAGIQREVLKNGDAPETPFAVYPVTRAFLPAVAQWPAVNEARLGWITSSRGSNAQIIQPGDAVVLRVWDSNENSLLTSPGQRQVDLGEQRVNENGSIFVPYVGNVRVAGTTPASARARVQAAIEPIATSAQVQLSMAEGRGNSVDLVGGATAPGIYPMPDRNFTVLSLISAGGGISNALRNPQIRLVRGSQIYGTSVDRLYKEPQLDTLLVGGDQVIVEEDERYFLSLGAAGSEATHAFPRDVVTAMDAVSIIGGVDEARANPKGILILREYPASALAAGVRGPRRTQVVFTLDLTTADGLFSARNFRIMPKDLVYVTESPLGATQSVFGLIGQTFGLVRAVPG